MDFNTIAVDFGHGCPYDTGANGIRFEDNCTKEVGELVVKYLSEMGKRVTKCTPYNAASLADSLYLRTVIANRDKVDLFVSIHFNSGGGKGTEVWAMSIVGQAVAQNICNAVSQLGYVNRGVKDGSGLYVIRNTDAPAVLVECSFLDSREDMDRYNADDIAKAIVYGITGTRVEAPKPAPEVVVDNRPSGNLTNPLTLDLQRNLNRLGITVNNNKLSEDGINGTYTIEAVKKFQTLFGLTIDGIAGEQTLGAISSIIAKPMLKRNSDKVMPVKYLQWRLLLTRDGMFGARTEAALVKFQKDYRLDADGICGNQTWKKLIG